MKSTKIQHNCAVATVIELIGNKWKALIMHELLTTKKRFNELRRDVPGNISQKVLTDNLRELERDGLITRTVFAEVPPRVEYELSDLGKSFASVLRAVQKWGEHYQDLVKEGKIPGRKSL